MSEFLNHSQALRFDDTATGQPMVLVIAPQSIRVEHTERGLLQEVFHPEGVEVKLECYECPNPACNCPDDHYVNLAIKIPKAEYERLKSLPGWVDDEVEGDDEDD